MTTEHATNALEVMEAPLPIGSEAARLEAEEAFRADLNHKLRTPLNAIIGFAELLVRQTAKEPGSEDARQILKSAREMLRIIESELSEPDQGSADGARQPGFPTATCSTSRTTW